VPDSDSGRPRSLPQRPMTATPSILSRRRVTRIIRFTTAHSRPWSHWSHDGLRSCDQYRSWKTWLPCHLNWASALRKAISRLPNTKAFSVLFRTLPRRRPESWS